MNTSKVTFELNLEDRFSGRMARAAEAAEWLGVRLHLKSCDVCAHYFLRRGRTLLLAVVVAATRHGLNPVLLMGRYLHSVHDRHLAGESLSTRKATPVRALGPRTKRITVQRSCNGCQKSLGDATSGELDAAAAGRPLPDVRLECGCGIQVAP